MTKYRLFTEDEKRLVLDEYERHGGNITREGLKELAAVLGRSTQSIESWYYRHQAKRTTALNSPQEEQPKTLVQKLQVLEQDLVKLSKKVAAVMEEVTILERWASDTLILKQRLQLKLDPNGVVQSVQRKELT